MNIKIIPIGIIERIKIFFKTFRNPQGTFNKAAYVDYWFNATIFIRGDRRWQIFGRTPKFTDILSGLLVHETLHLVLNKQISRLASHQLDNVSKQSVNLPSGVSKSYYQIRRRIIY